MLLLDECKRSTDKINNGRIYDVSATKIQVMECRENCLEVEVMSKAILSKVSDILSSKFFIQPTWPKMDSRLREDLGLYAHEVESLIWYLENQYNLHIPDVEIESLITVGDLVSCVNSFLEDSALYPLYLAEAV